MSKSKPWIKFQLTAAEHAALAAAADDGHHQAQTPDELAHDIVAMWLISELSKQGLV